MIVKGDDLRAWRRGAPRVPVPPIRATLAIDIVGMRDGFMAENLAGKDTCSAESEVIRGLVVTVGVFC